MPPDIVPTSSSMATADLLVLRGKNAANAADRGLPKPPELARSRASLPIYTVTDGQNIFAIHYTDSDTTGTIA